MTGVVLSHIGAIVRQAKARLWLLLFYNNNTVPLRMHYLRLLGEDTSIFEVNKFEEKKEKDRERREARERREEENGNQKCEEGGEVQSEEVEPVTDR